MKGYIGPSRLGWPDQPTSSDEVVGRLVGMGAFEACATTLAV
jgi:hypothetical protein